MQMTRIDTNGWGKFRVGDLFEIHPTKAYNMTNAELLDDGEYPVVVNSGRDNGIGGYTTQKPTEKGNMITFSDTTDATTIFYQRDPFVGYPHVQGLYPIGDYADKWSENRLLFFVSLFKTVALNKGFDYGNKFRRDIAAELMIRLPVTESGEPDWAYMDAYMSEVIRKAENSLDILRQVHI